MKDQLCKVSRETGERKIMTKLEKMVAKCREICSDSKVGYSQVRRLLNPDVDCSSLMYICAAFAGFSVPKGSGPYGWSGVGYTGTMLKDFTQAGFTAKKWDGNWEPLPVGTIMLNEVYHTEMIVDWNNFGGANIDENGNIVGNLGGDQTGREVYIKPIFEYWAGWDWALIPPSEGSVSPSPSPGSTISKKTVEILAKEVIGGLWGNNPTRAEKLKASGHDYQAVQQRVNMILANSNLNAGNVISSPDIDQIAWQVIRGDYGNGALRKEALSRAGHDALKVQQRVNELLG
jgi:hypothetical protein